MAMIFYPHQDELQSSTIEQKLEVLLESAERYKAVVLEITKAVDPTASPVVSAKKGVTPREINHAYNWEEISGLLRQIRELPETSPAGKLSKATSMTKLAEIYEVLRGAKMPKLEAVRLALINEANQLRGNSQVA